MALAKMAATVIHPMKTVTGMQKLAINQSNGQPWPTDTSGLGDVSGHVRLSRTDQVCDRNVGRDCVTIGFFFRTAATFVYDKCDVFPPPRRKFAALGKPVASCKFILLVKMGKHIEKG